MANHKPKRSSVTFLVDEDPGDEHLEQPPRGDPDWIDAWNDLFELHIDKSSTYGTNDDRLLNFTAVGQVTVDPAEKYALLRIIEKSVRALNMIDAFQSGAVKEYPDIASLALCCEALRRRRG